MSSVSILFNERKINKKGEVPIWLRIIKDRKPTYIALGIKIKKEQWNPETEKVRKSHPNAKRINNYIAKRIAKAEDITLKVDEEEVFVTNQKVKDEVMGRSSESFIKYAEKHIQKLSNSGKIGTHNKYYTVIEKLKTYLNNNDLKFGHITVTFLKEYEDHLRDGCSNSVNTIHSNLKAIRKLVNDAVKEGIITMDKNPFYRFKLHTEKSEKHFLTDVELKTLADYPLNPKFKIHHHRNMYVFAAYTGGIRISDCLQIRWKNYDGERLIIRTQKTDDTLSIKVPSRAKQILDSYLKPETKPNDYIFPFLKSDVDYTKLDPKVIFKAISSATAYANKDLKTLATACKINKKLHFHTSRHTFATLALKKGMRIEYLSKLLTHHDIKTTQVYAKIVSADLDKAMDIFED
jgi:site-specific recombinase XerD